MARLYYECSADLRNNTEDSETIKPYACTPDKYCLYCCCNSQCCLLVQRRPPRHFWEAWYFWLGIALLAVFIISSVSSYIVSNCRHNIQGVPLNHSTHGNRRNDRRGSRPGSNQNEISISIIPTSEFFPSHKKMFVIASQPAVSHLSNPCRCVKWFRLERIAIMLARRRQRKELQDRRLAFYTPAGRNNWWWFEHPDHGQHSEQMRNHFAEDYRHRLCTSLVTINLTLGLLRSRSNSYFDSLNSPHAMHLINMETHDEPSYD